ncbi:MAG: glycoside hydrolase family 3 N-terminal domain-containing protein [Hyphomonas sp.]|uniref:glycoside hydrolase family 3 N-terminal domain-containing protein n=1 Tax=Hyphomonas sp. TaxID=87 RepID=UPI003528E604
MTRPPSVCFGASALVSLTLVACVATTPPDAIPDIPLTQPSLACGASSSLLSASSRVRALVADMTLDEKLGQLNQAAGGRSKTLNSKLTPEELDKVRRGEVGSYLHVAGAEALGALQQVAVEESRLGIPLLFAMDVVHGYRTIFPVPIAMASTWDAADWESAARIAADEATASGLHWTFAPMVDIARDPRWGRIVEGAGVDPYLGARMAEAQVHGYQGASLSAPDTILATTKHFGVYGAPAGGRDYGSADVSERSVMETYMPPFYAATQAGSGSMMTAFNDIGGVPTTANETLVDGLLRDQWGFDGMIVSDWNAVAELMNHGVAATREEAGILALRAGVDMDMTSGVMSGDLKRAVSSDSCLMHDLDGAVARILTTKERLGLFDTPLAYHDPAREAASLLTPENRAEARRIAARSIVLLKNDSGALPLASEPQTIAVIGALAEDRLTQLGSWRAQGDQEDVISILEGLQAHAPEGTVITYAPGSHPTDYDADAIKAAADIATAADRVLLVIGEDYDLSGEARSRSDLSLPASQQALANAVFSTGKPVTVILVTGRPVAIETIAGRANAVLNTWMMGVEAGNALADVLWGKVSPAGRLPADFPRRTGAVPFTYSEYPSGRPADPDITKDSNRYHDLGIDPLYPFGYGLSYSDFTYDSFTAGAAEVGANGTVTLSVKVTNSGSLQADEVVQLYMRDPVASVARPRIELRGFKRLSLEPGETRTVSFTVSPAQAAIWRSGNDWAIEAGDLEFMVGGSSADIRARTSVRVTDTGHSNAPAAALETKVDVQ